MVCDKTGEKEVLAAKMLGGALFSLGFVGLFIPLVPTTIFWILAVVVLGRADPALTRRIRDWPGVGGGVCAFIDDGVVSRRAKVAALGAMSLSAAIVFWTVSDSLVAAIGLGVIAVGAIYVASRPSTAPR